MRHRRKIGADAPGKDQFGDLDHPRIGDPATADKGRGVAEPLGNVGQALAAAVDQDDANTRCNALPHLAEQAAGSSAVVHHGSTDLDDPQFACLRLHRLGQD